MLSFAHLVLELTRFKCTELKSLYVATYVHKSISMLGSQKNLFADKFIYILVSCDAIFFIDVSKSRNSTLIMHP